MVALETRWHGPTNLRGARISCRRMDGDFDGRKTTVFESAEAAFSGERLHFQAVLKFCARMDWHGKLVPGGTDRGYVWVWVPKTTIAPEASFCEVYTV